MRINRFVAATTGLSRRAADAAIAAGRVTIDGRPAVVGDTADASARISLDGQPLALASNHTYVLLHKPTGYISSRAQQGSTPTLYELLPAQFRHLRLTGRLDRDSSGLIVLTDDGAFIQRHTHPSYQKIKIYELTLSRALTIADRQRLSRGVTLVDGLSHVTVMQAHGTEITVSLTEGRNRQLRRTFGALGYTVKRLHRVRLGPYTLDGLSSGNWRLITPTETV